jgi:thiol-disulfide isomerase/thioredoxin
MKNKNIILLIVLLAGLGIWFIYKKYRVAPEMDFFALEVFDENGNRANLEQFRNKKLIVTYWAAWCGPCRHELETLNEIKDSKLADIEIVALTDEPVENMVAFRDKKKYPFHFYRFNKKFPEMGINSIPVNYLVNQAGKTVYDHVGAPDWNDNSFVMKAKEMME